MDQNNGTESTADLIERLQNMPTPSTEWIRDEYQRLLEFVRMEQIQLRNKSKMGRIQFAIEEGGFRHLSEAYNTLFTLALIREDPIPLEHVENMLTRVDLMRETGMSEEDAGRSFMKETVRICKKKGS